MLTKIVKDKEAQQKSALITIIILVLILLIVFNYSWTVEKRDPQIEIAILFDNEELPPPPKEPIVPKPVEKITQNSSPSKKSASSYKDASARGKENSSRYKQNTDLLSKTQRDKSPVNALPNSQRENLGKEESQSDNRRENSALNNLRRGSGTSRDGVQNNGQIRGSRNDGRGTREGNAMGTVGAGGRTLLKKIPGTMGDSRPSLSHNCEASGRVVFTYIVDRSGKVSSAYRSGGVSDQCLTDLGIQWIKDYVKANSGASSAKGTYKIDF